MTSNRYDLRDHLQWLLSLEEFEDAWRRAASQDHARVRAADNAPRRELGMDHPGLATGEAARWAGAIRALAGVLPPSAKPIARPFVQIDWLALSAFVDALVIEGARPIDTSAARELQDLCRMRLRPGAPLTNTEQKRLGRALERLDAQRVAVSFAAAGAPPPYGARVPLSATSMQVASMVTTGLRAPVIGIAAEARDGRLVLELLPLGGRKRGPKPHSALPDPAPTHCEGADSAALGVHAEPQPDPLLDRALALRVQAQRMLVASGLAT